MILDNYPDKQAGIFKHFIALFSFFVEISKTYIYNHIFTVLCTVHTKLNSHIGLSYENENIIESLHVKTGRVATSASGENSNQPRHNFSLIRVFTVRMKKVLPRGHET